MDATSQQSPTRDPAPATKTPSAQTQSAQLQSSPPIKTPSSTPPPNQNPSPTPPPSSTPQPQTPPSPIIPQRRPIETWYDTAREAWFMLSELPANKDRQDFTVDELYRMVDANWVRCCGERPKHEKWKISLHRALRSKLVCIPSTRKDAPSDSWAMFNPSYVSRNSSKKRRNADSSSGTSEADSNSKRRRSSRRDDALERPDKIDELGVGYMGIYGHIPEGWLKIPPGPVRLSEKDRAPALTILTEDGLKVRGMKGYRSIRATHGAKQGNWYFEVQVMPCNGEGNVRVGWSTRRSDVETPVGFDPSGYGIRDKTGEYYHEAKLMDYGKPFGTGDVIGCRIALPELTQDQHRKIDIAEKKWAEHKFVIHGKPPPDNGDELGEDSIVEFAKNGQSFGIAAANLRAGVYYPTISLYKNAVAKVNFGPTFKHKPLDGAKPFCEIAPPPQPPKEEEESKGEPSGVDSSVDRASESGAKPTEGGDQGAAANAAATTTASTAKGDPVAQEEKTSSSTVGATMMDVDTPKDKQKTRNVQNVNSNATSDTQMKEAPSGPKVANHGANGDGGAVEKKARSQASGSEPMDIDLGNKS